MIETCLSVALAAAMYLSSACSTSSYSPVPLTQTLPFGEWVGYVVRKNESLKEIARISYGSEDYWTTLWNDNPDIEDPEAVEKGTFLRVRALIPEVIEELAEELAAKQKAQQAPAIVHIVQPAGIPSNSLVQMPQPAPQPVSNGPLTEAQLNFLGNCEAGMNPARNSGNGYYGAFQFSYGTWQRMNTGYERADLAPIEVQKEAVQRLLQSSSIFHQFPACANRMRAAGLI